MWTGYKVHLTETCEAEAPHLITHVETTQGTRQVCEVTADIHTDLTQAGLPPGEHFVEEGYTDASLLVESRQKYGIELYGPVAWNDRRSPVGASTRLRLRCTGRRSRCPVRRAR
jgi:transposase